MKRMRPLPAISERHSSFGTVTRLARYMPLLPLRMSGPLSCE
jgi:hypothetical protein